jgi:hypothetical protein
MRIDTLKSAAAAAGVAMAPSDDQFLGDESDDAKVGSTYFRAAPVKSDDDAAAPLSQSWFSLQWLPHFWTGRASA